MLNKVKNLLMVAALAVFSFPALALAEDSAAGEQITFTPLVDASNMQSSITGALGPWVLAGIGVALAVVVVFLGWKWIRRFIGR